MYTVNDNKRITIVTGHYGSGKTEFSVSLAMALAKNKNLGFSRISLVDLDIANPYFRSRERKDILAQAGINLYGSAYDSEITAELPALSSAIRTPLEDEGCRVIVDVGGDAAGARVLHQFRKYFDPDNHTMLAVVNANRPATSTFDGVLEYLAAIENETKMNIHGIVNNCHLLKETTAEDVRFGHELCSQVCENTGKLLYCDCYPQRLVKREELQGISDYLFPLGLYMRPEWLDKY